MHVDKGMKVVSTPLVRNFLNISTLLTVSRIIRFLYLLVIAQFLSADQTGQYVYGMGFYLALIVLANFGLPVLLASRLKRRPGSAQVLISHSLTLRLICIGVALSTGVLITAFLEPEESTRAVVYIFLATLTVRSVASWVRECFIGLEDTAWIVRYEVLFRGGEALAGTCLLVAGAGLYTIVALHFVFWAAEAMFSLARLRRHLYVKKILGRDFRLIRRMIPISFVFMLSLGLFNVFPQIGVIAIKFMHADLAVVANFGIAVQIFTTVAIFPTALGLAVMPAIGRLSRRKASAEIANLTTVVKLALLLGGLLAIFADPFAPNLISAVLGERYHQSGATFGLLSWALGPFSAALIAGQALNALSARNLAARGSVIMVVMHTVAFASLLSFSSLHAATLSLMIGALFGCGANCRSLASVLTARSNFWWLPPFCLCALAFLLSRLLPLPAALVAPAVAMAFVLMSWRLKIVSHSDLSSVLGRVRLAGHMGAA